MPMPQTVTSFHAAIQEVEDLLANGTSPYDVRRLASDATQPWIERCYGRGVQLYRHGLGRFIPAH